MILSKIWLITGSSRGLGRALAESVLAAGEKLIATARDVSQLDDFPRRFQQRSGTVVAENSLPPGAFSA